MKTFSERCFETLARQKPFGWPERLERSSVTDEDILKAEAYFGYRFPEDFKEFLKSYILPEPTLLYGKFKGDWLGGGVAYSHALGRYLEWEEIPEDQEIFDTEFHLYGLAGIADIAEHTLEENIERLSWTKTVPFGGYIFCGDFTDYLMFLECETGKVVYIDHDFYTMSHQSEIDNIKEYQFTLFNRFDDFLKCLFLGAVCNGETAEIECDGCSDRP